MKKLACLLVALALVLIAVPSMAEVTQKNSVSIYTCYVEAEALGIFEKFTEETGIDVNYVRLSAGEIATRLQAEAENPQVSIFMGGSVDTHKSAQGMGLLDTYTSKNIGLVNPALVDSDGVYTPVSMIITCLVSNTDFLADLGVEAPTSWNELLDEKYKDDVCMAHPGTSGAAYTAFSGILQMLGEDEGFEYFKKLNANISQYTKAGAAPLRMAGLDEIGVAIGYDLDAHAIINEGYPLVISYPEEGVGYEITCVSMVKGGPADEVDAAHAFIDWMLEESCQEMATNDYYRYPTNTSIALNPEMTPLSEINLVDYDFVWSGENKIRLVERFENEIRSSADVIK